MHLQELLENQPKSQGDYFFLSVNSCSSFSLFGDQQQSMLQLFLMHGVSSVCAFLYVFLLECPSHQI